MISARTKEGVLDVRLHRIFAKSDPGLLDEIAAFIRGKKSKTPLISSFIRLHRGALKQAAPRAPRLLPKGKYHDLAELAGKVNEEYFDGRINAGITWGCRRTGRFVRRRTLGSYCGRTKTVRVNPILDKKKVPSYFLEFIIYHEMLHADIGTDNGGKRRSVHPREFRRREKDFKKYAEAIAWEKNNFF